MRSALHFTAVFSLAACAIDLPNEPGLRCDDQHPCSEGRDCIAGICVDEGAASGGGNGGGTAGGSGTAGGGTAGGGASGNGGGATAGGGAAGGATAGGGTVGDAGSVLWRQEVHGFTGSSDFGSASLTVRSDAGNQVISTVQTSDDTDDRATANMNDGARLPQLGHGRLKGKFRLPAALSLRANSTFVRLENGGSVAVSLAFNAMGQLVVRSDTGFVGPTSLTQIVVWPGGFSANTDYTVDIAWRRGQYRTLLVNGIDAGMLTTTDPGMPLLTPDELRLGIYRYDGDAGTGWSVTLDDWALADGPAVPL